VGFRTAVVGHGEGKRKMAKQKQTKATPPWERLETRPTGDDKPDALYMAVGKAITAWNKVELSLAYLFGIFVNPSGGIEVAGRAFGAVNTTSGKLDMVKAASDVFIGPIEEALKRQHLNIPDNEDVSIEPGENFFDPAIPNFKPNLNHHINTVWKKFGERRNDLAHGVVLQHGPAVDEKGPVGRWYLVPSHVDGKKWARRGNPTYCYTAEDVEFYVKQFEALNDPITKMIVDVHGYRVRSKS
jgi:hypothetical protein